jgi:hypothetical protein
MSGTNQKRGHSVDELMDQADEHLEACHFRAAVMEAFVALEEQINHVVFTNLKKINGFPDELVEWLRLKTRMDVAARIHPIGEAALGTPIGKGTELFKRYTAAKKIRNRVSHTAEKVTKNEAKQVIRTVRDWLTYLANIEAASPAVHEKPIAQEFLARFSLLESRFRLRKPDGSITTFIEAVKAARDQNLLSEVEAREIQFFSKTRNELAHALPKDHHEIAKALDRINPILNKMKGREFGFRKPE